MVVASRPSAAKRRIHQAALQTSSEKASELVWASIFPKWLLWMTSTKRFPLATWVVKGRVCCWSLKFRSVRYLCLQCRAKILINYSLKAKGKTWHIICAALLWEVSCLMRTHFFVTQFIFEAFHVYIHLKPMCLIVCLCFVFLNREL